MPDPIIEGLQTSIGPEPAAPADPSKSVFDETGNIPPETPTEAPVDHAGDPDWFERKYVEELRNEAARNRVRANEYDSTFAEMPDDLRAGWLELITLAQQAPDDPNIQRQLAEALGFQIEEEQGLEQPQYLTAEQAQEIARQEAYNVWQQGDSQRQAQEAISNVASEAEGLGYDANSLEYVELLYLADNIDPATLNGQTLLQAADQQLQSYRQEQYDAFVARKTEEANGTPVAPSGNGVSPSIAQPPRTWEEARNSLHERLVQGG